MALTTRLATSWSAKVLVMCAASVAFAGWGLYDLRVQIPAEEARVTRFNDLTRRLVELEQRVPAGHPVTPLPPEDQAEAEFLARELAAFGGETPSGPARYDRLVCWLFILCLPMAPFFLWQYLSARRRVYGLEEDGTVISPVGRWPAKEIVAIDMTRWMSKSVAWLVHSDGRRLKLDDHIHRETHRIVGAIAHRFHPDEWSPDGRRAGAGAAASADLAVAADETAEAAGPTRE